MQAYTYSLKHKISGQIYYGVRKSTSFDLFESYYTSSKIVKQIIEDEGLDVFELKLRRKFSSYEKARKHETALLQRINAISNPYVLNQAISSPRICSKDPIAEEKRRRAISETMKQKWQDPNYAASHPFTNIDSNTQTERGRKGAQARTQKYKSGELQYKPKKPKVYKEIQIARNGITKTIKANQMSAYRKIGWLKI